PAAVGGEDLRKRSLRPPEAHPDHVGPLKRQQQTREIGVEPGDLVQAVEEDQDPWRPVALLLRLQLGYRVEELRQIMLQLRLVRYRLHVGPAQSFPRRQLPDRMTEEGRAAAAQTVARLEAPGDAADLLRVAAQVIGQPRHQETFPDAARTGDPQ